MASRVKVVTPICSHETWVTAELDGKDHIMVRIESDCSNVRNYADHLQSVSMDDINELRDSRIMTEAQDGILTPTCLVPVAVFNVCWMEAGLISKCLAKKEGSVAIHFVD
jgi:hypothetical protein